MMRILLLILFLFPFGLHAEERAPQGEPPYPEYPQPQKIKKRDGIESPKAVDGSGAYIYDTEPKKKAPKKRTGIEQPVKVGDDGTYYYSSDGKQKKQPKAGLQQPNEIDDDGTYHYSKDKKTKPARKRPGSEYPTSIQSDGTYVYGNNDKEDYSSVFYFNLGVLGPFEWGGTAANSLSYKDVYSKDPSFLLAGGYEWKMFDFLGSVTVRIDSGFMFAEGKGRFSGTANANLKPKETFQFVLFPNTFSLVYKFESSPSQYVIPYLSGGAGYFAFWERRTDNKKNSFGGAPVMTGSGGLLISLRFFNKLLGTASIDSEYGVSQSWLNLQYRRVIGLDSKKNLSSNMIMAGVAFGF